METRLDELERVVTLRDGTAVRLRAIRPDDGDALVALFHRLSERTVYQRFFTVRHSLPPAWVHMLTHVDYDRRLAIVAEISDAAGPRLIGVARYDVTETSAEAARGSDAPEAAEIALVVEDAWQGFGLGTLLLHLIMRAGEARGVRRFRVDVLAENRRMLRLLSRETAVVSRTTRHGVTEALVEARH